MTKKKCYAIQCNQVFLVGRGCEWVGEKIMWRSVLRSARVIAPIYRLAILIAVVTSKIHYRDLNHQLNTDAEDVNEKRIRKICENQEINMHEIIIPV